MALIVEDGTGLATAESYCTLVEAAAYHTAQGNAAWAALASDTVREQCLRRAAAYLVNTYRDKWAGTRMLAVQVLDWPRSLVPRKDLPQLQYYANNAVPTEVKNANAALALRAATLTLLADQGQRKSSVTVGPISTTYEAGSSPVVKYTEIDAMLRPFMARGSGQIQMVRQ